MKLMTITTKDLMVDETGVFCENLQPAASQQQTLAVLTQFNFPSNLLQALSLPGMNLKRNMLR